MEGITIINQDGEGEELKNFTKGYLTFPLDGEQFKDFISGLLGKPQSITKSIIGNFEIHLSDLQSMYELINQRVIQQNKGRLLQFTSKIYYTDRSSVQLGTYEELITYNEVKPVISTAVKLTWDYLIHFADKTHPEKQVIELLIVTAPEYLINEENDVQLFYIPTQGQFRINIEHTARSFGADIENTLTNQIKSLFKKENSFKQFIRKQSGNIGLTFALIFLLMCIIGAYIVTRNFINTEIEKVKTFTVISSKTADEKLNFLTSYIASGVSSQHYFKVGVFLLIALILSIIFGAWINETAENNRTPSFIVLTRKSLENRDRVIEKLKHKWRWFFISILISIVTGVITNYIFKIIVE